MLPPTIATAALGADRVDDRGERLVAVAVGALVVREVGGPHHPVDADAVDEVEPERVDHERREHVLVPVVLRVVLHLEVGEVPERRGDVLGVLDGRRHPVDPALEPPDAQAGVPVEDAAEDVLAERVAERRHGLEHPDADRVELVRRRRRVLADVVRHREARLLDGLPHAVHRRARVVDRAASRGPCRARAA